MVFSFVFLFLILPSVLAEEQPIEILFPENEVTYGPWSETYFDYPRTGSKAHHIRITVSVREDVAYYRLMRNNEWVQYVGNLSLQDAVPENSLIEFAPDDLEPLDLIGYLSAFQNLTAVAYAADGRELGRDSVVFYIAVNLDDYYELLASSGEMASSFTPSLEDLGTISVTEEQREITSRFFTIKKYITFIIVRNKFTGDVENHTRVRFVLTPTASGTGQEVLFYSIVPKEIVSHLNNLTITGNYSVVSVDPIMMWHFSAVQGAESLEYDINLPLNTEAAEEIVPIAIAAAEKEKSSWYYLIPLIIPVVLLFFIVYFSKFKKKYKD